MSLIVYYSDAESFIKKIVLFDNKKPKIIIICLLGYFTSFYLKMDKDFIIRNELEKDYDEVENLTRDAFWNVYRPGCNEHLVIQKLRNENCFIKELDYVIEKDNKIIANIVYAKSKITQDNGLTRDILIFGPISVLPEYQKKGYGSYIIKYTMNKAKEMGYTEIAITGNPNYIIDSDSKAHLNIKYTMKEWIERKRLLFLC